MAGERYSPPTDSGPILRIGSIRTDDLSLGPYPIFLLTSLMRSAPAALVQHMVIAGALVTKA